MAVKPKFRGEIVEQDGVKMLRLHKEEQDAFRAFLERYDVGREMTLTPWPYSRPRTSGQPGEETNFNGYWWGVIIRMICDETGETDQDWVHHWVQIECGNFKATPKGDKIPLGTSWMSGAEFADLCAKARAWASMELNLFIPQPHEASYGDE